MVWDEGEVSVEEFFAAMYDGANDVTFGGLGHAQWSASATVVPGVSKGTGTNSSTMGD
jgi:hypothetical protein